MTGPIVVVAVVAVMVVAAGWLLFDRYTNPGQWEPQRTGRHAAPPNIRDLMAGGRDR